ncbi:MAG: sodium:solute symporter, partial [Proteobacteria bacterium]|nr:sodium:solute symporter [Pseudomonadota bacterium]
MGNVFWPGIASMAVLYVAVFLVGVFASKRKESKEESSLVELMLAGRSLPLWVGLLTMTATWVGGGYINGTAEYTFSSGILWGAQAGIGFALSLTVGGLFYARIMRRHDFTTLVDPLECRYGRHTAAVLMIPAVLAEMFWSAAILVALGSTFGTVIGLDLRASIVISAAVAISYTVFGGLRAVAYTDVIQMFLLLIGLGITIPFAVDAAGGWQVIQEQITVEGFGSRGEAVSYGDWTLILILGGIPWNVYFQRVLSCRDEAAAAKLSISAGFLCALMAIPPLILGLCGAVMDWEQL